jgi:transcriptional regulator with XRE-family HTH domain
MNNLTRLRKEKKLTQEQLAEKLNISRTVITYIENSSNSVSKTLLKVVADYFEITIDELEYENKRKGT